MSVRLSVASAPCQLLITALLHPRTQVYQFTAEDLDNLGEIGCGNFGTVNKMFHRASGTVMAVKVSRVGTYRGERQSRSAGWGLEGRGTEGYTGVD